MTTLERSSTTLSSIYVRINSANSPADIDHALGDMWRLYGEGRIADADAEWLTHAAEQRRPLDVHGGDSFFSGH